MELQPQVDQARNMSIGEHRHCCVTFQIKGFVWEKNYRFYNLRNEKQFTLLKMCVTSPLCGPLYGAKFWTNHPKLSPVSM